jgi:hypothetical protein
MGQTILKVDFQNKKVIPNQQNNSDSFYINKEKVCDGEATIFQTKNVKLLKKRGIKIEQSRANIIFRLW